MNPRTDLKRPRRRDAARSRQAILDAAERLFSEHGYADTPLQAIAEAAGLSRGTPAYFYGSKSSLYAAVLERVHDEREAALEPAFAPLRAWATAHPTGDPHQGLRGALATAVDGYLAMLDARPAFVRLIAWEALQGGHRLQTAAGRSTAIIDALRALHGARQQRALANFDPTQVLVAFVSLCYLPIAHHDTFQHGGNINTADPAFRSRYRNTIIQAIEAMLYHR